MGCADVTTSKSFSFGGLKIQTKFPPIVFNLYKEVFEITYYKGTAEFKYKTHGMWFMILGAILPLIFKSIPFSWQAGLGIGFGVGMLFNILSLVFFKIKMKIYVKALSRELEEEFGSEE